MTPGSVGFDLFCREDVEIMPRTLGLIPGNAIVQIPIGYMLLLALRSSTPRRKGLCIPHGVGIIDQDYCGEDDEIMVQVYNFCDEVASIKRGERVAQGIFVPIARAVWDEVNDKDDRGEDDTCRDPEDPSQSSVYPSLTSTRGGFGSTGM